MGSTRLLLQPLRLLRRLVILAVGGTVVLVGVIMIVTPGPALLVIPAGLAILSLEFLWARRLLQNARRYVAHRTGAPAGNDVGQAKDKGLPLPRGPNEDHAR